MKNIIKFIMISVLMISFSSIIFAQVVPKQIKKLTKASHLSAKVTDFSATLTWQLPREHNYTKALIYRKAYTLPLRRKNKTRDPVDLGKKVAEIDIKQQRFGDTQLEKQTRYYYRVVLQDEKGQKSLPSMPAIAALKDFEIPSKVDSIKADVIDATHFNLRWAASSSSDVQSYRILRSLQNEQPVIVKSIGVDDATNTLFSTRITQRKNVGLTYYYGVSAVDAAGNVSDVSPYVPIRLADIKPPRSPILLKMTQKNESMYLSWRANKEDDLKGYNVYRKLNKNNENFIKLNAVVLTNNSFIDSDITGLSRYRYHVSAVDNFANESKVGKGVLVHTRHFKQLINTPQNVQIKVSKKGFPQLSWQPAISKSASLKSTVFRSEGDQFKMLSPVLMGNSFIDYSIQQGKAYQYTVKTVTPLGQFSRQSKRVLWTGAKQ